MFRTIIYYENWFLDFYRTLDERAQVKVDFGLKLIQELEFVPADYVKSIVGSRGIYELRARVGSNQYRVLFFFESGNLKDGGRIVVLGNRFLKKDDRDYKRALALAEKIRADYFDRNR